MFTLNLSTFVLALSLLCVGLLSQDTAQLPTLLQAIPELPNESDTPR